jgi:hypothetical protein
MSHVLASGKCAYSRFVLGPIRLQQFMFNYIAQAILVDAVHLAVGMAHSPGYDHDTDTIYLDSFDISDDTIVHESTHALVDATHAGMTAPLGLHETTAYLAEAIFAINDDRFGTIDDPKLMRASHQVAKNVLAFNASNPGETYRVSPQEILTMQVFMEGNKQGLDKVYTMNGLKNYKQKYG